MSVDPATVAAAGSGGAAAAGVDAQIAAELQALAADAQALQQQVAVGDTVTATVLPSNGLSDLLTILGNRVAASLPPTLSPGDTITARVTGFNGDQILLQILSTADGNVPSAGGGAPPSAGALATEIATLETPPPAAPASPGSAGIAPPASAFVAATVRPNAPVPPPIPPGTPVPEPAAGGPGTIPGAPGTTVIAQVFGGIEARLAAARAAAVSVLAPANQPALPPTLGTAGVPARSLPPAGLPPAGPPPGPPPAGPPPAGSTAAGSPPGPAGTAAAPASQPGTIPLRPFVVPPQIATRFADPLPAPVAATAPAPAGAAAAPAPGASVAAYQTPLALVRALQLPATPTNIAAATLALTSPQRLPAALATLTSALPQTDDPRVATYRAIAGFIGKIEPSSPQLATQIAAYVEHVVAGSEPALAQLLAARATAAAPAPGPPAAASAPTPPPGASDTAAPAASESAASAPAAPAEPAEPTLPSVALAQIVERAANIASSLKEQLFQLVAGAPAASGDEVVPAAASALTAVTAVQMSAAQAAAAAPGTISFAIPLFVGSSYAQAQVTVDRDAPEHTNVPLDGDNFHIAFVLDTKNLGTVAIDLRTVGRAFSLSVKTENLRTAQRFGDELSRLTDRLGTLRYQAKSVEAVVASPGGVAPTIAPTSASTSTSANDVRSNDYDPKFSEQA